MPAIANSDLLTKGHISWPEGWVDLLTVAAGKKVDRLNVHLANGLIELISSSIEDNKQVHDLARLRWIFSFKRNLQKYFHETNLAISKIVRTKRVSLLRYTLNYIDKSHCCFLKRKEIWHNVQ